MRTLLLCVGETVIVGNVRVTVVEVPGDAVLLRIDAPSAIEIAATVRPHDDDKH